MDKKTMYLTGGIAGGVVLALAAVVLILPQLIPTGVYRERIEASASQATGRQVRVGGNIRLSVFPRIEAHAGAATISNPQGFGDAPFASMKELRAAVKLFPLFASKVEVDEFVLVEPNIALIKRKDGVGNWVFTPAKSAKPAQPSDKPVSASLGDVRILNGVVSYEDQALGQKHSLTKLALRARMDAMDKPFDINASGEADTVPFKMTARLENPKAAFAGQMSGAKIDLKSSYLDTKVDGDIALGDKPSFDVAFEGKIPNVQALATALKVADFPARAALGQISASGSAKGTPEAFALILQKARHESPLLNADFSGDATIAERLTFNLTATASAPDLDKLATAIGLQPIGGDLLGTASATTKISGNLSDIAFKDVSLRHASELINLAFDGSANLAKTLTYDGQVDLSAPDIRKLAEAVGSTLPAGDVYRAFTLSGRTAGTSEGLALTNALVTFDDIKGSGDVKLDFKGKPRLSGTLSTSKINLTPYAVASGAPPATSEPPNSPGWPKTPIDLSPLKLVDANLSMKADGIQFQKFDFGPTALKLDLKNGKLIADMNQTALFGGKGSARAIADGSGAMPGIALKADIDGLALRPLLAAAANFDKVEGAGLLQIDLTGQGATLDALMSSLAGAGAVKVAKGTLHGVDVPVLVKEAPAALANRKLPPGAIGASATTAFRDLAGAFKIKDGVAAMQDLAIQGDSFTVSGGGSLDVGGQKLSLSLFPQVTNSLLGVKGLGLPVKVSGSWDKVSIAPDYAWLLSSAKGAVQAKVQDEIRNQLRKQLGGDLSDLISGGSKKVATPASAPVETPASPAVEPSAPAAETATNEAAVAAEDTPKKVEDQLKSEAKKALGDLLRRN